MSVVGLSEAQLQEIERRLAERVAQFRLLDYRPYRPQAVFHARGRTHRERLLLAPNQTGKTLSACAEVSMHLTGRYPRGWQGKVFDRPVRWTSGSVSAELTRKGVQRLLVGPPELEAKWGTGMIPKEDIVDWTRRQGVPNALDSVVVQHYGQDGKKDGHSILQLNSYEQGVEKWASDTLDGVHLDEEPPEDIYFEALTRTNVGQGPVMMTATPLLGMTQIIMRFYPEPKLSQCALIEMSLGDVSHYSEEEKQAIIATYPEHMRGPRAFGKPQLGEGMIFPVLDEDIAVPAFQIPDHWPRIAALDFGWTHPAAVVWYAHDLDTDCVYLYDCHKEERMTPPMFASVIKSRGQWIPVAWPHDGENETQAGPALAAQLKGEGVNMRPQRAQFPEGTDGTQRSIISVEAGLHEMLTRMQTGRYKVFSHLEKWFREKLTYHRKRLPSGAVKIVKERDDLMSASRVGIMDLRYAKTKPAPRFQRNLPGTNMLDPYVGY